MPQRVQATVMAEQAHRFAGLGVDRCTEMVLEVFTHTRRIDTGGNTHLVQVLAGTDARQHQQLRRGNRSSADDHLGSGTECVRYAITPGGLHTDHPHAIEQQLGHVGLGAHFQVRVITQRPQVGHRRTGAPPV